MYPMVGADGGAAIAGLLTPSGRELLDMLAGEAVSPDRALALSASLRKRYPPDLVAAALTQQALRVAAAEKFSRAGQMLFTRAGLEQASSELTARHAAARFAGSRFVADLCCGIGGNLIALAQAGSAEAGVAGTGPAGTNSARTGHQRRVMVGVDADLLSAAFAGHNLSVCAPGAQAAIVCADVTRLRLGGVDAVFIDPARRDGQRRLGPGRYRPALDWCLRLADAVGRVGIKAAPGLSRAEVPAGWETEFVAVGRDLKEALLWSPGLATGVASRATILPGGHTLTSACAAGAATAGALGRPPARLAAPGGYLIDPSPAVTRAGLVTELASQIAAWQIDPMIAFLSSDEVIRTPFGRTLRVLESAPWHEKAFAHRLRELGIGSADIRRRGLAGDVATIHRRLGLSGPGSATVVMTRVKDRPWGLICVPITGLAAPAGSAG